MDHDTLPAPLMTHQSTSTLAAEGAAALPIDALQASLQAMH